MNTAEFSPDILKQSIMSVPPLARNRDRSFNRDANKKMIQHLEAGGVTTLLYGGNANLYHVSVSEYAELLSMLTELAGINSLVIPSVGPSFGMMMDQAKILREFSFPTSMVLPTRDAVTSAGVGNAIRKYVDMVGHPAILYIKYEGYVDITTVKELMDDGCISCIKYAIVRENTADDNYLRALVDAVDPARIVSGIGEQPAIIHLRDFGLAGFTSGCVCVAPKLSMNMLQAIQAEDFDKAEQIRSVFEPLEDLRNAINPIRVLHTAVQLSGIAETGPMIPLLSELDESDLPAITEAAKHLLLANSQDLQSA